MSKKKKDTPIETPKTQPIQEVQPVLKAQSLEVDYLKASFWRKPWLHALLVFVLGLTVYANTLSLQYAVDDSIVILRNQFTKKGMKGMKGIWSEDTFVGFFGKQQNLVAGGRYRPFSVATFAVEMALWGEPVTDTIIGAAPTQAKYVETTWRGQKAYAVEKRDAEGDVIYKSNPMWSHAINVLLFGWLSALIYFLLALLLRTKTGDAEGAAFVALAAAALYATHPLHTEAVANIKGRDEILVSIGSLLALYWAFKGYLAQGAKVYLYGFLASIAFLVGIFSKENAITFVAIIPLAIYIFGKDENAKDLRKAMLWGLPFLVLSFAFWFLVRRPILGVEAQGAPMPELMNDPFMKLERGQYVPFTFGEKLNTCLYTWGMYLKLLVLPHPLTNDYYPKHIHLIEGSGRAMSILSLLVHGALAVYGLRALFRRQVLGFVIGFYAATFSVVSNLFFPIGTTMAERFMFLPSMAFSMACGLGLYHLLKKGKKSLALGLVAVVLLGYSLKTFARNYAWFDDYTLFTTDIPTSPNSAKLNNAVSGVLQDKAATIKDEQDPSKAQREDLYLRARKHALKAIELHPTYNSAWLLLGNSCVFLGNTMESEQRKNPNEALVFYDEAIKAYKEVLRLRPDHPDVKRNFGVVYRDKGKLLGQTLGRVADAVKTLEEGLTYNDQDLELLRLAGVANGVAGNHQRAKQLFEQGLKINESSVAILYNLGVAYRIQAQATNNPEFAAKADELDRRWKAIDPNYNPLQGAEAATIQNTER